MEVIRHAFMTPKYSLTLIDELVQAAAILAVIGVTALICYLAFGPVKKRR